MNFNITLAGVTVGVETLYPRTRTMCERYLSPEDAVPAFTVKTTPADIEFEQMKSVETNGAGRYSDGYLETLAVYRQIAEKIIPHGALLIHCSAIALDGQAYLFLAKSGTGKSTHARLWRERFGERAFMVNDDKPLLRVGETVEVCGTPWNGKHNLDTNTSVPVRGICFLERDTENHIVPVSRSDAYPRLLRQIYRPTGTEEMLLTLKMIDRILETVPCYLLGCNMDPDAARVSYEGMKNGNTDL